MGVAAGGRVTVNGAAGDARAAELELWRDAERPLKRKVSQLDKNLEQLTVMYHKLVAQNSGLKVEISENDKKIQRKDQRINQLEGYLWESKQKFEKLFTQCAKEKLLDQCANFTAAIDTNTVHRNNIVKPMRGRTATRCDMLDAVTSSNASVETTASESSMHVKKKNAGVNRICMHAQK